MAQACIALGSNLGDRARLLDRAVELIASLPSSRLLARSDNFPTAPQGGPPGQGEYLNAAVRIETDLPPGQLLAHLQQIESLLGRPPPPQRICQGPRTIDLDLLLYDQLQVRQGGLVLPHPRMHLRRFVLEPLAQVAGEVVVPGPDLTVRQLLDRLTPAP